MAPPDPSNKRRPLRERSSNPINYYALPPGFESDDDEGTIVFKRPRTGKGALIADAKLDVVGPVNPSTHPNSTVPKRPRTGKGALDAEAQLDFVDLVDSSLTITMPGTHRKSAVPKRQRTGKGAPIVEAQTEFSGLIDPSLRTHPNFTVLQEQHTGEEALIAEAQTGLFDLSHSTDNAYPIVPLMQGTGNGPFITTQQTDPSGLVGPDPGDTAERNEKNDLNPFKHLSPTQLNTLQTKQNELHVTFGEKYAEAVKFTDPLAKMNAIQDVARLYKLEVDRLRRHYHVRFRVGTRPGALVEESKKYFHYKTSNQLLEHATGFTAVDKRHLSKMIELSKLPPKTMEKLSSVSQEGMTNIFRKCDRCTALQIRCSNSINGHAQPYEGCAELGLHCTKPDGADNPRVRPATQVREDGLAGLASAFMQGKTYGTAAAKRIRLYAIDDGPAKVDVDDEELKVLLDLWTTKPGRYRQNQRPDVFGVAGGFPKLGYRWIAHLGTEYVGDGQDIGQHGRVSKTPWITSIIINDTSLDCGVVSVPKKPYVRVIIVLTRSSCEAPKGGRQGMFDRGGLAAISFANLDPNSPALIICVPRVHISSNLSIDDPKQRLRDMIDVINAAHPDVVVQILSIGIDGFTTNTASFQWMRTKWEARKIEMIWAVQSDFKGSLGTFPKSSNGVRYAQFQLDDLVGDTQRSESAKELIAILDDIASIKARGLQVKLDLHSWTFGRSQFSVTGTGQDKYQRTFQRDGVRKTSQMDKSILSDESDMDGDSDFDSDVSISDLSGNRQRRDDNPDAEWVDDL